MTADSTRIVYEKFTKEFLDYATIKYLLLNIMMMKGKIIDKIKGKERVIL